MAIRASLSAVNAVTPILAGDVFAIREFNPNNLVDLSIRGSFVGTLALQRRFSDDVVGEWYTTDSFTTPFEGSFTGSADALYRVVFTQRTSGTAEVRLSTGA